MTDLLSSPKPVGRPDEDDDLVAIAAVLPGYVDRREAAIAAWLAGDEPQRSWLGRLLHTEVEHDGACYGRRLVYGVLAGVPIAVSFDLAYAGGKLVGADRFDVLPLGPLGTVLAVLAGAAVVALAHLAWHAQWHREEAPYIHNYVIDGTDPAGGC